MAKVTYTQQTALAALNGNLKEARAELAAIKKEGVTKGPRLTAAQAKVDSFTTAIGVVKRIVAPTPADGNGEAAPVATPATAVAANIV